MKKILGKILGIIFVLILGCQQICYADMILYDKYGNEIPTVNKYANETNEAPQKFNNLLKVYLTSGSVAVILVGASIIVLTKAKKKDEKKNEKESKDNNSSSN